MEHKKEAHDGEAITLRLTSLEAYYLRTFLVHAKFGDWPKAEISFHPLINDLIAKLTGASPSNYVEEGWPDWSQHPPSAPMLAILEMAKESAARTGEDFEKILAAGVYPGEWKSNRPE